MASEPSIREIEGIVRESGARVRSARGFSIMDKGSVENIVTSADLENEGFLKERLTALLPGSAFIGEEGDEASLSDTEWVWIVDPIDGTTNFSRGIPMCAVSVALFRNSRPWAGFVLNPFTDTLYSAARGRGAFKNGTSIRVSDRPFKASLLSTAYCCYEKSLARPCFEVSERLYPEINDIRRIGTAALELALMAEGAGELYFEIRLSPWDHAAGLTILEEAGGCHTGIRGDVRFDAPGPVLAANSVENLRRLSEVVDDVFGGRVPYRCRRTPARGPSSTACPGGTRSEPSAISRNRSGATCPESSSADTSPRRPHRRWSEQRSDRASRSIPRSTRRRSWATMPDAHTGCAATIRWNPRPCGPWTGPWRSRSRDSPPCRGWEWMPRWRMRRRSSSTSC